MIIPMDQTVVYISLVLFGLALGSFSGATVWRLRARQLKEDEQAGEKVNKTEFTQLKQLLKKSVTSDRSMCLHCHHQLAWYDLLPLVSWVQLGGKCRYCHKPIGYMEPLIELGTATFFVVSYAFWPMPLIDVWAYINLGIWLVVGIGLIILFAYDSRWYLLPDKIVFPLIGLAGVHALLQVAFASDKLVAVYDIALAATILSGIYYILYVISQGKWIGFGDIKLGLVLALMLGQWELAFLALFLANIIGCLVVLPGLATKKLSRTSHVPFGPMLIAAYFIVGVFGYSVLEWYLGGFSVL